MVWATSWVAGVGEAGILTKVEEAKANPSFTTETLELLATMVFSTMLPSIQTTRPQILLYLYVGIYIVSTLFQFCCYDQLFMIEEEPKLNCP